MMDQSAVSVGGVCLALDDFIYCVPEHHGPETKISLKETLCSKDKKYRPPGKNDFLLVRKFCVGDWRGGGGGRVGVVLQVIGDAVRFWSGVGAPELQWGWASYTTPGFPAVEMNVQRCGGCGFKFAALSEHDPLVMFKGANISEKKRNVIFMELLFCSVY